MHNYTSYKNYGYQLKNYFLSGFFKLMDLGNVNQIEYPKCMSDQDAIVFDSNELAKDFITVGNDIRKALDSYGKKHTI